MESESSTSTSSGRRSIGDCVGDMYLDDQLADIHFSFPNEKVAQSVPAHKMLLVAKSPVFKAMFCGKLAEKGSTVKITDITSKIFRLMLKHVYTDKLMIGADNVGALLHASQKYQLESLITDCEKYLKENLAIHNACTVLQQSTDFALFDLANCAHKYMCEHATDIVSSEDFTSLSQDNLENVLGNDGFDTDEILIFKAVMKWVETKFEEEMIASISTPDKRESKRESKSQAKKRKKEDDMNEDKNKVKEKRDKRRELLGDILYQIRFNDISVDDFNEIVIPSGILTEHEQITLLRQITLNPDSKQLPLDCGEFNMYSRCDPKTIPLSNIYRKLPDRILTESIFPKHLRNCMRIHMFSTKPFKITTLNIVPNKSFGHRNLEMKKAAAFCQIKGTDFGKKYLLDYSEYSNQFIDISKKIEANKEVVIEVILTDGDGLITNKTECIFETLDCEVPERENWIKHEISSSQEVKMACEGINIVQDLICYPVW